MKIANASKLPVVPASRRCEPPPVPFEVPATPDHPKERYVSFHLLSNPSNAESKDYKFPVLIFKDGTPQELLDWQVDFEKVCRGQNITDGADKHAIARRLLSGEALRKFNTVVQTRGEETSANLELSLRDLFTHFFPQRALAKQKRYMRRYLRKPRGTKMRNFIARFEDMDRDLARYPPGFNVLQTFTEDEKIDIYEYGIPASWSRKFIEHGFDPLSHTRSEFIEFCERLEYLEGVDETNNNGQNAKSKSTTATKDAKPHAKSSVGATKRKNQEKWCALHNVSTHDTGECKVVLHQVQQMRSQWDTTDTNKKRKTNNYSSKNVGTKELNTLIQAAVQKSIDTVVNKKKRKKKESEKNEKEDFHFDEDFGDLSLDDFEMDIDDVISEN